MSERTPAGKPGDLKLPVVWIGTEETPVLFANQVLSQIGPQGEIVLTFGQLVPRAFVGTEDQIAEEAKQTTHVSTQTVARLVITRTGLDQLIDLLNQTAENSDRAQEMLQQVQKRVGDDK
jgi:methyl-accepting chemotaxis protein